MKNAFRYKTAVVVLSLLLASVVLIGTAKRLRAPAQQGGTQVVAASSYPIYIAARNLTESIDALEVVNLTASQTGCIHDFTLRPQDMITLRRASVLLINGGGLEPFLDDAIAANPTLPVIDSSAGISPLAGEAHDHAHDHDHDNDHDHDSESSVNAHFWMSPADYMQQVTNLRDGLCAQFPAYESQLRANADRYLEKIAQLRDAAAARQAVYDGAPVILFHDAFAYFARDCGLTVVHTIQVEQDTVFSAAEIVEIVNEIRDAGVKTLLAEAQYSPELANAIAAETDAQVYIMDTAVSGDDDPDAYLNAMYANLDGLDRALAMGDRS